MFKTPLALLALLTLTGCESEQPLPLRTTSSTVAPDRLLPGETLPGREKVFGIEVPPGLRVTSQFTDVVQLSGHVRPEAVTNYLRKHVVVDHVELGAQHTVFPRAYLKHDASKRLYRIDIVNERGVTNVKIRDITPPPVTQGLTEAERWERAGRNLDGSLKDRLKQY